jgi:enediyne biosynthesis protein E4
MQLRRLSGRMVSVGLLVLTGISACGAASAVPGDALAVPTAAAMLQARALSSSDACSGSFVAHDLPHTSRASDDIPRLFDSNGSGVAVADLDGDRRPEIILADLSGPNQILWNEGGLRFTAQPLDDTNSRGVQSVDVDGDGRLDLVFSHRAAGLSFWRNMGERRLTREMLRGVTAPAYSMAWADLDRDGRLDLVTASYDAETDRIQGRGALFTPNGGVYVYHQREPLRFSAERLATTAQGLALLVDDLNQDGQPDIWVGNDFLLRDMIWYRLESGWQAVEPFKRTSENTMSLDSADIDNDGAREWYAVDMKPYTTAVQVWAQWLPLMATMPERHPPGDPQKVTPVLQFGRDGSFSERAANYGVDAVGWAWSTRFADLDADGFVDLYAVNGMIAPELFPHLPGHELVEANQALRNLGGRQFAPAEEWQLDSTRSGRGMVPADLDGDGDLDIVVNNLQSAAQLFENRLCGGRSLLVELRQPGTANPFAVGAELTVVTDRGVLSRVQRSGAGYLSGDPMQLHVGLPADATISALQVRWPDGAVSRLAAPDAQMLITITRGEDLP